MKTTVTAAVMAAVFLVMPALIVAADEPVPAAPVAPARPSAPAKCIATDMFQLTNDTIKGFRPKPCLLQPVKPFEAKPGQIPWFQHLANGITRKNTPLAACVEQGEQKDQ